MIFAAFAQSMTFAATSLSGLAGSLLNFARIQSSDDTIVILISFLYELTAG